MACVLKLPEGKVKGILTFTDGEHTRDILANKTFFEQLAGPLKKRYVVGMHNNRADKNPNFVPDPFFDFYIAGRGDFECPSGASFYQIPMHCSNFGPDAFARGAGCGEPFWDVLTVARNVRFKSLPNVLAVIRKIFDTHPVRVLAIIPHEKLHGVWHGPSDLIQEYLRMFSPAERRLFTLMTPSIDYPFPFDIPTLAFFYRHSKVFLGGSRTERHTRVTAYASATGLPVIAPEQVGALIPEALKRPPGFYAYQTPEEGARAVLTALQRPLTKEEEAQYASQFLARHAIPPFKEELKKLFAHLSLAWSDTGWILSDLDIRLGRHHTGEFSPDTLIMTVPEFVTALIEGTNLPPLDVPDFERALDEDKKRRATVRS